jgi:hypothetical protein
MTARLPWHRSLFGVQDNHGVNLKVGKGVELGELREVLSQLAATRPIFHSEADFQHAFAWAVQLRHPTARVRLEEHIKPGVHLDLSFDVDGQRTAVELKYIVRAFRTVIDGEHFVLRSQAAQDIRRYDVAVDLMRLEALVESGVVNTGLAIILTNDAGYWQVPRSSDTVDVAFRLHQGRRLSGTLAWGAQGWPGHHA